MEEAVVLRQAQLVGCPLLGDEVPGEETRMFTFSRKGAEFSSAADCATVFTLADIRSVWWHYCKCEARIQPRILILLLKYIPPVMGVSMFEEFNVLITQKTSLNVKQLVCCVKFLTKLSVRIWCSRSY